MYFERGRAMEKGSGMRVKILLALILGMSGLSAHAGNVGPDCQNATDQTSLNICADKSYHAADKQLNLTYDALNKKTSVPGQMRLKKAQRSWIAWRDAQCDFETTLSSPYSAHSMVYAGC